MRLIWAFDDPTGEDVPEEERLEKFREVRDEIEQKIIDCLEHPEKELEKLRDERERERRERIQTPRLEAENRSSFVGVSDETDSTSVGVRAVLA